MKGAVSTAAGIFKFTDETTVVPGQFSQDFNLRAPVAGETVTLKAVLLATAPDGTVREWSSTRTVLAPK